MTSNAARKGKSKIPKYHTYLIYTHEIILYKYSSHEGVEDVER